MGRRLSSKLIIVVIMIFASTTEIKAGSCTKVGRDCIDPGGTREFNGFKVYRDCWQYRDSYKCKGYSKNNCAEFEEDMDCREDSQKCIKTIGGNGKQEWCVAKEKEYTCISTENYKRKVTKYRIPSYKQNDTTDRKKVVCNEKVKCIDGKCVDWTNEPDKDTEKAWAMLKALGEMKPLGDPTPMIFTGQDRKCVKKLYGLNNCCKPGKSIPEKLDISSCSINEKQISELKKEGRCHYIGSYKKAHAGEIVAGAVLGGVVGGLFGAIKKRVHYVYCCFESRIAAEIQIQGRGQPQINKPWGTAREPNCEGFTVEELESIDFEKIDFSFLTKEIHKKMGDILDKLKEKMNQVQADTKEEFNTIQESMQKKGSEEERFEKKTGDGGSTTNPKPDGRNEKMDDYGLL